MTNCGPQKETFYLPSAWSHLCPITTLAGKRTVGFSSYRDTFYKLLPKQRSVPTASGSFPCPVSFWGGISAVFAGHMMSSWCWSTVLYASVPPAFRLCWDLPRALWAPSCTPPEPLVQWFSASLLLPQFLIAQWPHNHKIIFITTS